MMSVPLPPSRGIFRELVANPIPNIRALSTPRNSAIRDSHLLCNSEEPVNNIYQEKMKETINNVTVTH